jgi:hypothetical protein
MQEIMMNKIIPISKKARKKLRLARYPALSEATSVFMAEAATLALVALITDKLGLRQVTFLSDN